MNFSRLFKLIGARNKDSYRDRLGTGLEYHLPSPSDLLDFILRSQEKSRTLQSSRIEYELTCSRAI